MRFIKFIFALAITLGFTWAANHGFSVKDTSLPALGSFLNPVSGFWANAEVVGKAHDETLDFPELSQEVRVLWDERMVPHIFAQNLSDALFVQGYITAKHRLWQMDITARAAAGTLSEVFGKRTLTIDSLRRGQGVKWAAENAIEGWKEGKNFNMIEQYAAGVNAFTDNMLPRERAFEYKLFDQKLPIWTAEKSALVVKSMALSLCVRQQDIPATNTLEILGKDRYDFFFPEWNPKQSPIIPAGTKWDFEDSIITVDNNKFENATGYIPHDPFALPPENIGSNNWAISAEKSATGNPILCNDPHLNLTLPAIWFELQIHTPDFNAYGVSVPGIPGILIGFNENIAWGETNVGHDLVDWYKMDWTDEKKNAYRFDNNIAVPTMREELIYVKGQEEPIRDTVVYTRFGPITYSDPNHPNADLAMRWIAHDKPDVFEFQTFLDLAKAKNHKDYVEALKPYISPAQNFVFASKDGDIAITANGRFPIKKKGQGRFVLAGNTSANEWQGFIPREQIPQVKNPERGFVSSANQHTTDPSYPYYYNAGFADYRGRYLNRKLAEKDKFTVEDMMALQADNYSLKAEEALPLLISSLDEKELNTTEQGILSVLKKWDYKYDAEKVAPVIFDAWWKSFYNNAWDEWSDSDVAYLQPEEWRTIELMETHPELSYWDIKGTTTLENLSDLSLFTFKKAADSMVEKMEEEGMNYTNNEKFFIPHLGRLKTFYRNDLPIGGTKNALNANRPGNGPSWRMIVELGDEINAWGVYPGGQSGNPSSPFFDDMVDHWAAGKYYKLNFLKSPDELGEKGMFEQRFN
jgi:penicillin amidase